MVKNDVQITLMIKKGDYTFISEVDDKISWITQKIINSPLDIVTVRKLIDYVEPSFEDVHLSALNTDPTLYVVNYHKINNAFVRKPEIGQIRRLLDETERIIIKDNMFLETVVEFLNIEEKDMEPYYKGEWVTYDPETDKITGKNGDKNIDPDDLKELITFVKKDGVYNTLEEANKEDWTADYDLEAEKILPKEMPTVRDEMVKKFAAFFEVENDNARNRIWGPLNAGDGICSNSEGPCRMLYCNCYRDTEEEVPDTDWFTGRCDYCQVRLLDPSHAVRAPMEDGGWRGCFCDFNCIRKSDEIELEYDRFLLTTAETIIKEFGIIDRTKYYD